MEIHSSPVAYYLLDMWFGRARKITVESDGVRIQGGSGGKLAFDDISGLTTSKNKLLGKTVHVPRRSGRPVVVRPARSRYSKTFTDQLNAAWISYRRRNLEAAGGDIDRLCSQITDLKSGGIYPAACVVDPLLTAARSVLDIYYDVLPEEVLRTHDKHRREVLNGLVRNPSRFREEARLEYSRRQLEAWKDLFDNIESNPLTVEQRDAVISEEDATLVLAGAGSGKTSVITAKTGYLVAAKIRKPEEILLMAFARDAATEMSERIQQRCGIEVEARTFHALAYEIIGSVEGSKPPLADYATDERALQQLLKSLLLGLPERDLKAAKAVVRWFGGKELEVKYEWDFETAHEYYQHLKSLELRTLQGEQVKSYEELMIANWLFENSIPYKYEAEYEHQVSDGAHKRYCPDFFLPEAGVYIEHFGVRENVDQDGNIHFQTAPNVDTDEYVAGMDWKRSVHSENGTILVETFSQDRQEGRLLEVLDEKLSPYVQKSPKSLEAMYSHIMEMRDVPDFVTLLGTFLKNFKSGGYSFEHCESKAKTVKLGRRAKAFLTIFRSVYDGYQEALGTRIDFEDMILRAAEYAETGQFKSRFRHILVDEFQDISRSRARLVAALMKQDPDVRLFAVGDDWQSIYRFAGSDVSIMREFAKQFGGSFDGKSGIHRTVDLGRTFRSVDKLASAARRFVLKNPSQITKTVAAAGNADGPVIQTVDCFKHDAEKKFRETLQRLDSEAASTGKVATVLLLGRYRFNAPANMRDLEAKFRNLEISFKTIHSSKGLEADHVVLLQVFQGKSGFPSEKVDDPLLLLVSPDEEAFPNAEERRVMYVAMTRARFSLTIMSSSAMPSHFVLELKREPEYGLSGEDGLFEVHECKECGGEMRPATSHSGQVYYRCEHEDLCGNYLPACTTCGKGLPVRSDGKSTAACSCGELHPSCPKCDDGWLVPRVSRYGEFKGCVKYPRCTGKARG